MQVLTDYYCPECAEAGGSAKMDVRHMVVSNNNTHLTLLCWTCECEVKFDLHNVDTEYGDDGYTVKGHGTLWPSIVATRKDAGRRRFWEAYRNWRSLKRDDPEKYRTMAWRHKCSRRMGLMAEKELLKHAQPIQLLERFASR